MPTVAALGDVNADGYSDFAWTESPAADVFDRGVVRRLVAEHREGTRDHSEALWTLLNLVTWRETFRC